jgi:hypothetical protein
MDSSDSNKNSDIDTEYESIDAIDSDFLFLYTNTSSLPGIGGRGVFAKYDIPPDEIICEYRGPAVSTSVAVDSRKLYSTKVNGKTFRIIGNTICAFINDCAHIYGANYTVDMLAAMFQTEAGEESIPTFPGYDYNARADHRPSGKIFIKSIRHIKAHEEICFSYGR